MEAPANPVVRKMQLARTLRRLRLRADLTLEQAAEALEASAATVSRIETGQRVPGARDVRDLLRRYDVTDRAEVDEVMGLVAGTKEPAWWEAYSEVDDDLATYIGLETAATLIQQSEGVVVPGLLQTPAFTREYLRRAVNPTRSKPFTEHDLEKRAEVTANRQDALRRRREAGDVRYEVILDEAVLHRVVGGNAVMREQLDHMAEIAEGESVDLRLIPFSAGAHPGQASGFEILTLPKDVSDIVYMDAVAGQLFLDDREGLQRHRRVFEALRAVALTEIDSIAALKHIRATEFGD